MNYYGIKGPLIKWFEVKNSKGPKTDPWGPPAETSQTVDDVALLITFCFL
jgi:hypothetical protein